MLIIKLLDLPATPTNYQADMDSYDALAKIVIIGDSFVGKTCLILRYTQDIFRETFLSTIGVDFKSKVVIVNSKRYKLQLWDTAGQERYNSLRRGFYRGAKGVIIVYDMTNNDSYTNITKWMEDMRDNTGRLDQPAVMIIGNKLDLVESRVIQTRVGRSLANEFGVRFAEVSAKTGEGMDEAFDQFTQDLVEKIDAEARGIEDMGETVTESVSVDLKSENGGNCAC